MIFNTENNIPTDVQYEAQTMIDELKHTYRANGKHKSRIQRYR